jgi:hypothetical protein
VSTTLRLLSLCALLALPVAAACDDEDGELHGDHPHEDAGGDGGTTAPDAGPPAPRSALPRPGLPRPPTNGLPPELLPPR